MSHELEVDSFMCIEVVSMIKSSEKHVFGGFGLWGVSRKKMKSSLIFEFEILCWPILIGHLARASYFPFCFVILFNKCVSDYKWVLGSVDEGVDPP